MKVLILGLDLGPTPVMIPQSSLEKKTVTSIGEDHT